ncbi:MAG: MarR family transcriptional regulator [Verrucomicrobiales bacterium]|nr:MarR family transcriptional regulator [Verrucomicrobiales bacterium]
MQTTIQVHDIIDPILWDWREQKPDTPTEALGIVLRIQVLEKLLAEKLNTALSVYDIEWWEYDVLATLRRQGNPYVLSASEILKDSILSPGALTNRINRLLKKGLVTRAEDPVDRRKVMICLTESGIRLVDEATRLRFECALDAVRDLTPQQASKFDALLKRLVKSNGG